MLHTLQPWLLLVAGGVVSGLLNGCLGLGGMSVYMPLLIWLFKVPGQEGALLLSTVLINAFCVMWAGGLITWLYHHQQANVHYPCVERVGVGAVLGACGGYPLALALGLIDNVDLLFGAYLVAIGIVSYVQSPSPQVAMATGRRLFAVGASGGFLGSLVGFNGNSVFIPLLRHCGLNIKEAIATGQLIGMVVAAVMVMLLGATYGFGRIQGLVCLTLGLGGLAGSHLGARLKRSLSQRHVRSALTLSYVGAGLVLLLRLGHP